MHLVLAVLKCGGKVLLDPGFTISGSQYLWFNWYLWSVMFSQINQETNKPKLAPLNESGVSELLNRVNLPL